MYIHIHKDIPWFVSFNINIRFDHMKNLKQKFWRKTDHTTEHFVLLATDDLLQLRRKYSLTIPHQYFIVIGRTSCINIYERRLTTVLGVNISVLQSKHVYIYTHNRCHCHLSNENKYINLISQEDCFNL